MKIAMIGHKDFPSRSGGVEVVVSELAPRLVRRGHSVTAYNRCGRKGRFTEQGVEVRRVPAARKQALNALTGSVTATLAAVRRDYDVIHYHALGPSVMLAVARLLGKPTVATVHGLDWQRAKWSRFASAYLRLGERIIARYADEVIVLSENVQGYFRQRYNRETLFIPNGITPVTRSGPDEIKRRFGLEENGFILYLARIVPEKGLHYLLEAFSQLDTDKTLVVAGELPDNEYGGKIRRLAEGKRVIFTGFVQGRVMAELYSNCCLYVLPSEVEGLALTLLEAMSAGARCLTSDIPENTAVTGRFGYSFKCSDVSSLRDRMSALLRAKPPDCQEQLRYVAENYSWEAVTEKTEAAYLMANQKKKASEQH